MGNDLGNIQISLFRAEREIFTGKIEELSLFWAREESADRVVAFDGDGRASVSMKYQDLLSLLGEEE